MQVSGRRSGAAARGALTNDFSSRIGVTRVLVHGSQLTYIKCVQDMLVSLLPPVEPIAAGPPYAGVGGDVGEEKLRV